MQKTSPRVHTVQYIRFHSCTFQALAYIDIESLGLQLSTKVHDRKKTRRIKIRDTTFWNLLDMFPARFGPQFSESVLFRRFPALFRRFLSSEFSVLHVFLAYLCSSYNCCRIHFGCLLERCCKCQKATNNSSETAFCGQ